MSRRVDLLSVLRRRESIAVGLIALSCCACKNEEQKPVSAPRERSQVVAAASGAVRPSGTVVTAQSTVPSGGKPRKALCQGELREGKPLPRKPLSQAAASESPKLKQTLSVETGSWTWVNFWAAWCAPCKEEIPRLVDWERKLQAEGRRLRVSFVSLDDDERQLMQFLSSSNSLRSTYWLKEGREREEWMSAAGLDTDPELPIHLLIDPQGKIRCRVQGAVEDSDYESLARLVGG